MALNFISSAIRYLWRAFSGQTEEEDENRPRSASQRGHSDSYYGVRSVPAYKDPLGHGRSSAPEITAKSPIPPKLPEIIEKIGRQKFDI